MHFLVKCEKYSPGAGWQDMKHFTVLKPIHKDQFTKKNDICAPSTLSDSFPTIQSFIDDLILIEADLPFVIFVNETIKCIVSGRYIFGIL